MDVPKLPSAFARERLDFARLGSGRHRMPARADDEGDSLLHRLWELLDEASTIATSADARLRLEDVGRLCDQAAGTAYVAAKLQSP